MVKGSRTFNTRAAGVARWSLVLLVGLTAVAGCSTANPSTTTAGTGTAPSAGPKTDPVLQPLVGSWELDCGNGFVLFKLVVANDYSAKFDWQTYVEPGSPKTSINKMDLTLSSAGGTAEATVKRADVDLYAGKKMKISPKDADSIVLLAGPGGVVDTDQTLTRESLNKTAECGGD